MAPFPKAAGQCGIQTANLALDPAVEKPDPRLRRFFGHGGECPKGHDQFVPRDLEALVCAARGRIALDPAERTSQLHSLLSTLEEIGPCAKDSGSEGRTLAVDCCRAVQIETFSLRLAGSREALRGDPLQGVAELVDDVVVQGHSVGIIYVPVRLFAPIN